MNSTIVVYDLVSSYQANVISLDDGDRPLAIALDPTTRFVQIKFCQYLHVMVATILFSFLYRCLYWTSRQPNASSKIERASMDGTGRTVVAPDLYHSTAVTLDTSTQTLYWVAYNRTTSYYYVESSNTNGSNRQILGLLHAASINIYHGSIYYPYGDRIRSLSTVSGNVTQLDLPNCFSIRDLKIVSFEQQLPGTIFVR